MKCNKLKLEAYAAFTAAFLSGGKLSSQIIMQDFDPDLRMMNWGDDYVKDDSILIDIDSNGVYDLLFHYDFGPHETILDVKIKDAVTAIYANSEGYILPLYSDDIVWNYLYNWKTGTNKLRDIFYSAYIGSYSDWCNTSNEGFTFINDYIPIKLQFDDGMHYGWVRLTTSNSSPGYCNSLHIGSPLVVYDIAYNSIPDEPINCDASVGPESIPYFTDKNDADDFSEFEIEFNYEDIPGLGEIRFYFLPGRDDVINFSVADAREMFDDRYISIDAESPELETGSNSVSPSPGLLDINGDAFQTDHYYSVMALNVPSDSTIMRYHLSAPSQITKAIDNYCYLGSASVTVQTIHKTISGFDINLIISPDSDETDLSEYKIGFINSCSGAYLFSHFDEINLATLPTFVPEGKVQYSIHLTNILSDVFNDPLNTDNSYYPVLIGIGDGINKDGWCYTINCNNPFCIPSEFAPSKDKNYYQLSFSDNLLSVELLHGNTGEFRIELKTITGQNVISTAIESQRFTFDLSRFSKGEYVACIYNEQTLIGTEKILVR